MSFGHYLRGWPQKLLALERHITLNPTPLKSPIENILNKPGAQYCPMLRHSMLPQFEALSESIPVPDAEATSLLH